MTQFNTPTLTREAQKFRRLKRQIGQDFILRMATRPPQPEGVGIDDRLFDAEMESFDRHTTFAVSILNAVAKAMKVDVDSAKAVVDKTRFWHELNGSGLPQNAEGLTDDIPADVSLRRQPVSILRFMRLAVSGGVPVLAL